MDQEITLQQAVQALRKQYGERIDAGQEEGRDLMADALEQQLAISRDRAKGIVRDMEAAHSVRWIEPRVERGQEPGPAIIAPGAFDPDTARIAAGVPEQGYWQL
jgi:hypothetical protein